MGEGPSEGPPTTLGDGASPQAPSPLRWIPLAGGVGAVTLMLALLAGLLISHAGARTSVPTTAVQQLATVSPLPVSTTTLAPSGPQWRPVLGYTQVAGLALAPSDPRTGYQLSIASASKFNSWLVLKGTHDEGATWHDIAPPAALQGLSGQDLGIPYGVAVNPLDPNTVYLTISANMSSCPNGTTQASVAQVSFAASQWCTVQYYSRDAGASWHVLSLPAYDLLTQVQAQGKLLWGMIGPPLTAQDTTAAAGHLAKSSDGGVTWTFADSGLPSSVGIALYAPAAAGNAVFVVSDRADRFNSGVCGGCLPPANYKVWRSDNVGGSWTQMASLPYSQVDDYIANLLVARDATALYLSAYTANSRVPTALTSTDGGRSWSAIPGDEIGASSPQLDGLFGVLADGSLIAAFSPPGDGLNTTHTFYAWKPATANWRALAAPFSSPFPSKLLVSSPASDGSQALLLQYEENDGPRVAILTV